MLVRENHLLKPNKRTQLAVSNEDIANMFCDLQMLHKIEKNKTNKSKKKRKKHVDTINEKNIDIYIGKYLKSHPEIFNEYIRNYIRENLRFDRQIFRRENYKFKALTLYFKDDRENPITYCDAEIIH